MIRQSLILFSLILLISTACNTKLTSRKVVRNDIEMLYGKINPEQLYFDFPEWMHIENEYNPDEKIITKLKSIQGKYNVKIFLGTWCSDSRREVPHYYKILKTAGLLNNINTEMWAVDRKFKLDKGLAENHQIEKVATFIFYRDDEEIGRIIESPEAFLLEEDILNILTGQEGSEN